MTDPSNLDGAAEGITRGEEDLLGPELRAMLGSLPRELAPERDLSMEIAARTWARTAAGATEGRHRRTGPWRRRRLGLVAAAAALIVVTSVTTTLLVRRQIDAPATVADASINSSEVEAYRLASYERMERDYAAAISDLTAAFDAERDRLPPETVRLIEENLAIIDHAIEESLAALRDAPRSLPLQQALVTSYETKLDFLRRAAAITAEG